MDDDDDDMMEEEQISDNYEDDEVQQLGNPKGSSGLWRFSSIKTYSQNFFRSCTSSNPLQNSPNMDPDAVEDEDDENAYQDDADDHHLNESDEVNNRNALNPDADAIEDAVDM